MYEFVLSILYEYKPLILRKLIIPQASPAIESDKGWASRAYKE